MKNEPLGIIFFIEANGMDYVLETPDKNYKPYMEPPRNMILNLWWVADELRDSVNKYGGKYRAFKAACEGELESVRDDWVFIKANVSESIAQNKLISKIDDN